MVKCGAWCSEEPTDTSCTLAGLRELHRMFESAMSTFEPCNACPSEKRAFYDAGMSLAALKLLCKRKSPPADVHCEPDRSGLRLQPGEVGLNHDRATFAFGGQWNTGGPAPEIAAKDGGNVYYNVRPPAPRDGSTATERLRKHVVQMFPSSVKPVVGPVTGLPVGEDEHVVVLRFGKRPGEPDEKARLQIELRIPKRKQVLRKDVGTQCSLPPLKKTARPGSKKEKKTGRPGSKKEKKTARPGSNKEKKKKSRGGSEKNKSGASKKK